MEPLIVPAESAQMFWDWLQHRGGVRVWRVSDSDRKWLTPANTEEGQPYPNPTWQADPDSRLFADPAEVMASVPKEVRRFRVAGRLCGKGKRLFLKLTYASKSRILEALFEAGRGAYDELDYASKEAVIFAPERELKPILDYICETVTAEAAQKALAGHKRPRKEFFRFHVAMRTEGGRLTLTDASSVREAMAKAGEGACCNFEFIPKDETIIAPGLFVLPPKVFGEKGK